MAGGVKNYNVTGYGFGYDYQTHDCKLVRVVDDRDSSCPNVYVYTLSSNSWKITQSIPCYFYYAYSYGKFYEGALHWLAITYGQCSIKLECFGIINETFQEMALPEELEPYTEQPSKKYMFNIDVGVLEGCLCLVLNVYNVGIDVWMMQEYGVRESWAKSVSPLP
ncbi:F-box protein CPR1-like [Papaver somniferum]|uniref:F-box protein CPR1-like n=1 Tax=Papaver somniferum TaxID=3469 RepID=UPI000E7008D6|nr:F-box protein CPR1-like [Papaver somniferum]